MDGSRIPHEGAAKAPRCAWLALAVLALPTLLVTMDLSVLFLAVPALTRDLEPSSTELLWISDAYGFMIAGSLLTMGALADRIGHRRMLMIGGIAFAAASLVAAFAVSPVMLIGARAALGVAGATLAPSSLALIRNLFEDERQRTTAIGIWLSCFAAGAGIGPVVGGVLLDHFWWGSVFLPNVPVMLLLLILGPRLLPDSREEAPPRVDLVSAGQAIVAMLALIYAVKRTGMAEFGPIEFAAVTVGIVVGARFIRRQRTRHDPLLDVGLFGTGRFRAAVGANMTAAFIAIGIDLFTVQYLQLVLGMSPLEAGLWSLPSVAGLIGGSMLAPALSRRVPAAKIVVGGLLIGAAGLLVLTQAGDTSGLAAIVIGTAVVGLGAGAVGTLGADLIVSTAPPERAGAASGISETGSELGAALGIALLGSLGAAVYRANLGDSLPAAAPASARETLGGAIDSAGALPAHVGARVVEVAHSGFAHSLHVVALTSAALSLAMAIAAVQSARQKQSNPGGERLGQLNASQTQEV